MIEYSGFESRGCTPEALCIHNENFLDVFPWWVSGHPDLVVGKLAQSGVVGTRWSLCSFKTNPFCACKRLPETGVFSIWYQASSWEMRALRVISSYDCWRLWLCTTNCACRGRNHLSLYRTAANKIMVWNESISKSHNFHIFWLCRSWPGLVQMWGSLSWNWDSEPDFLPWFCKRLLHRE